VDQLVGSLERGLLGEVLGAHGAQMWLGVLVAEHVPDEGALLSVRLGALDTLVI